MKTLSIITAGLAIMLSASIGTINAQQIGEPAVKILPTNEKGILKIMYAYATNQPVTIVFYNEGGLLASDKVKGDFRDGFSKKYDVRKVSADFWIEVRSMELTVTFKMVESRDGQSFLPVLEKTTYNHALVAANN